MMAVIPFEVVSEMATKPQRTELRAALVRLEANIKSMATQVKSLVDDQRELCGKADRMLYAILGIGAAIIATMVINQVVG